MYRRLSVVFLLLFALLPLAPAQPPPQELARPAAQADRDAEAIVREVNEFYAQYWKAWNERDAEAVAAALAPDFVGLLYVPGRRVVELDKQSELAGVGQFFQAVEGQDAAWRRRLLGVVPRTETEAVAAVRSDFSLGGIGGEIELSLEVLRRQADGRWVLVRKYAEKSPF